MLSLSFASRLLQSETRLPFRIVTVDISKQQRNGISKGRSQPRANLCLRSIHNVTANSTSKSSNAKRDDFLKKLVRSRDGKVISTPNRKHNSTNLQLTDVLKNNKYILSWLENIMIKTNILMQLSNHGRLVNNVGAVCFKPSEVAMSEGDKVPQNYFGEKMSMLPFLKRRPKVRQTVKQGQSEDVKPEAGGGKKDAKDNFISTPNHELQNEDEIIVHKLDFIKTPNYNLENEHNIIVQKQEQMKIKTIEQQKKLMKSLTLTLSMFLKMTKQNGIAVYRKQGMSTKQNSEIVGKKVTCLPPLGPPPVLQPPPANMPSLPSCPRREKKETKKEGPCKKMTSLASDDISTAIILFPTAGNIIPADSISTINVLLQPLVTYFNYDDSETVITRSSFDVCEISEEMASLYE